MTNGSLGCSACGATIKIKWAEKTYWNEQQKSGKKASRVIGLEAINDWM